MSTAPVRVTCCVLAVTAHLSAPALAQKFAVPNDAAATGPGHAPSSQLARPPFLLSEWSGSDSNAISRAVAIVDVNSTIAIAIDHDAVRTRLGVLFRDSALVTMASRAESLRVVIESGGRAFQAFVEALRVFAESPRSSADLGRLRDAQFNAIAGTDPVIQLASPGSRLRTALTAGITAAVATRDPLAPYQAIFDSAAAEARRLKATLDSMTAAGGIYVQLGGFLRSGAGEQPVHIPRFDTYAAGERNVLPSVSLALSEADRNAYRNVGEQARRYNEGGFQALTSDIRAWGRSVTDRVQTTMLPCTQDLPSALQAQGGALASSAVVATARQKVQDLSGLVRQLATRYRGTSSTGVAFLIQASGDLQRLVEAATDAFAALQAVLDGGPGSATQAMTPALDSALNRCKLAAGLLRAEVAAIAPALGPTLSLGQALEEMQTFGSEVQRQDLRTMASNTEIDLPATGRRGAGDILVIRMVAGRRDDPPIELESRRLILERTRTYVATSASLIFAHPFPKTSLERYFQAGASYSVLAKPLISSLARSSVAYNELVDFGLGVNVAELDFDKDDTPEIGLGLVISALKDVFQAGWGYDMGTDQSYWFFALRLPLLASQLPAVRSGTQSSAVGQAHRRY